jgi:hypothetical protein
MTVLGIPSTVDTDQITCGASSAAPWVLHARLFNPANRSTTGTINIDACTFSITISGTSCVLVYDGGQSLAVTYTNGTGSLVLNGSLTVTLRAAGCLVPGSFAATLTATYTVRPDTRGDRRPTVTAAS